MVVPDEVSDDRPEGEAAASHTHLVDFPEALEAFLTRLPELTVVLGPGSAAGLLRVQALVREGLAARDRGDVPAAVERVLAAMRALAEVAGASGVPEAPALVATADRFAAAMRRGAVHDARQAAEVMREESGSRLLPKGRRP